MAMAVHDELEGPAEIEKKQVANDEFLTSSTGRVCDECGKVFSNGKALGGHVRSHNQERRRRAKEQKLKVISGGGVVEVVSRQSTDGDDQEEKLSCCVCGKGFLSHKSLFGHMRTHPERGWRGVQPPPPRTTMKSPSSESTISDEQQQLLLLDCVDTAAAAVAVGSSVVVADLKQFLPCFPRRPRTWVVNGDVGDDGHDDDDDSTPSHSHSREETVVVAVAEQEQEVGGCLVNLVGGGGSLDKGGDEIVINNVMVVVDKGKGIKDVESDTTEAEIRSKRKKKKSKKRKLEELEQQDDDHHVIKKHIVSGTVGQNRSHTCIICNRSFATHQALGGHRASHNKNNNNSYTLVMDEAAASASASASISSEVPAAAPEVGDGGGGPKVVKAGGGDGNTEHRCNICNRSFPTGQALGGHKRRHWTGPVEAAATAPSSSSTQLTFSAGEVSQTHRKIFPFDLNEAPPVEYSD